MTPAADPSAGPKLEKADSPAVSMRFRQLFVGALRSPSKRVTWELTTDDESAHLRVRCDLRTPNVTGWVKIDGHENEEAEWLHAADFEYVAPAHSFAFSQVTGPNPAAAPRACGVLPPRLTLTCKQGALSVLAAGALPDRRSNGHGAIGFGRSPSERVFATVCSAAPTPGASGADEDEIIAAIRKDATGGVLAFVPPTARRGGIEWVDENSDMVLQAAAFRWMAPGSHAP